MGRSELRGSYGRGKNVLMLSTLPCVAPVRPAAAASSLPLSPGEEEVEGPIWSHG